MVDYSELELIVKILLLDNLEGYTESQKNYRHVCYLLVVMLLRIARKESIEVMVSKYEMETYSDQANELDLVELLKKLL